MKLSSILVAGTALIMGAEAQSSNSRICAYTGTGYTGTAKCRTTV